LVGWGGVRAEIGVSQTLLKRKKIRARGESARYKKKKKQGHPVPPKKKE